MTTRRGFLHSLVAATATVPALRNDALARVVGANRAVLGRSAGDVAQDEDYWQTIQQAFDIDRGLINLNNGGVAPSPRVVQQAFERYLAVSNQAPAITMWGWIEPEIESVRRRLAASFGCDPDEMAITRNASEALEIVQLGLPLERGDEVLTTTQDYPRMITTAALAWTVIERRPPIAESFEPITHDGLHKLSPLFLNGSTLYFQEFINGRKVLVATPANGGEATLLLPENGYSQLFNWSKTRGFLVQIVDDAGAKSLCNWVPGHQPEVILRGPADSAAWISDSILAYSAGPQLRIVDRSRGRNAWRRYPTRPLLCNGREYIRRCGLHWSITSPRSTPSGRSVALTGSPSRCRDCRKAHVAAHGRQMESSTFFK